MLRGIEIEVTSNCNWRCHFCPVSFAAKEPKSMSMCDFRAVLQRAKDHGTFWTVSINSYNEPSIDPLFMDRCVAIKEAGFSLLLHTNGSGLTEERLQTLLDMEVVSEIVFNLPTLDKEAFETITKSKRFDHAVAMIDKAYALRFKRMTVRVNGSWQEIQKNAAEINARWPGTVPQVFPSVDRLGVLTDQKYAMNIKFSEPRLYGCSIIEEWLYVSVHGDAFLCCEDYYQKSVYGNILSHSIEEVRSSPAYKKLYAQINGEEDAAADLICRSCFVMKYSQLTKAANAK